jgi:hypothetical protein
VAAEGQGAVSPLDMGGSSCGFDRTRSRPANYQGHEESDLLPEGEGEWLIGLSAAATEVPPGVESGIADQGVPGGSKNKSAKRNTGEEEGGGGGGSEGRGGGRGGGR